MQGFNKYYPPDYDDAKHKSLNAYHGKHALGDRARKINQGILITRFELPFNIWCGTCNAHIGMGVRYNAEKKKVGAYFSTPIYSFRCKCHLCGGWFEIRTDPKNTRYVVTEGARQKEETWDPESVGGHAVHDTEAANIPVDPLKALEKTKAAEVFSASVQAPRIESLYDLSERQSADPYTLSSRLRRTFREQKKVDTAQKARDDELKARYGLAEDLALVREDEGEEEEETGEWRRRRAEWDAEEEAKRRMLEAEIGFTSTDMRGRGRGKARTVGIVKAREKVDRSGTVGAVESLAARLARNTAKKADPFGGFTRISSGVGSRGGG